MNSQPIIFVQPPVSIKNKSPCLDDQQYGLGMLANAAWLEHHGFEVAGIHIPLSIARGMRIDNCLDSLEKFNPLLIAIGLNWVHFSDGALEIAKLIKARLPDCPIVIGGQHASLFADEIAKIACDSIDGVILGEAEIPLLRICESLRLLGTFPTKVPGLVCTNEPSRQPEIVRNMDDLPLYRYSVMSPSALQKDVAAISTTRGPCPFKCSWCLEPVVGRLQGRHKLQFHSAKRIVDQIEALEAEGITKFTIQDNFFVGGDRKLLELSIELQNRHITPVHINIFAHPESFSFRGLQALASCCKKASVDYGVETGSVSVALKNNRRFVPEKVVESISSAVEADVEPYTWWMVGLPGEGVDALAETEELVLSTMRAGGVPRWVSQLILFPKTPIHESPEDYEVTTRFNGFSDYSKFSRATLAEALLFGETSTHATQKADAPSITAASQRLRKFILKHMAILREFYQGKKLQPNLDSVESRVLQSFF